MRAKGGCQDEPSVGALLRQQLGERSGIRLDKVEAICRAIAAGEYRVDGLAVADRILAQRDGSAERPED